MRNGRRRKDRRAGLLGTAVGLGILLLSSTGATAAVDDRPVPGTQLMLSRASNGKERLVFQTRDPALVGPAASSLDDPTLAGVTIELYSDADGIAAPLTIPSAAAAAPAKWEVKGPNDFQFTHRRAPAAPSEVRSLQLQSGRQLRIVADEVPLSLAGTSGTVIVRVTMGSVRYCARFDGESVKLDRANRYRARGASTSGFTDCSNGGVGMQTPLLPMPSQACQTLVNGTQNVLGYNVKLWFNASTATLDGPFVFVWHGAGGTPDSMVSYLLGGGQLQSILDQGGIVAGFQGAGNTIEFGAHYLPAADQLLACAMQQLGFDHRRIHSMGFSAGGLQTTVMGMARSNYVASVVAFSGGFAAAVQDPDNKYPALVVHGGPNDIVIVHFDQLSVAYYQQIVAAGHFAILCNHNQGHTVPSALNALDVAFLLDHPYGTERSPYLEALPAGYPGYCAGSS